MKKVRFFSSYCSNEQIYKNIISSWGSGCDSYKDIKIVRPDEDYDYAVVFNLALPDKKIDKNRVIGFSHEPRFSLENFHGLRNYINVIQERVGEYYIGNADNLPEVFKSGFSFVCPFEYGKSKKEEYGHEQNMSMVLSLTNFMDGHKMRHMLLEKILKTDMDIHFYAKDLNKTYPDERVKDFDWDLFHLPYENYKSQIVIENIIEESWSSEKLTNCVIKGTIPLYYGSKNMASIFYGDGIKLLGKELDENMEIITEVYKNNKYNSELAKSAKNKLYESQNLLDFINSKFK